MGPVQRRPTRCGSTTVFTVLGTDRLSDCVLRLRGTVLRLAVPFFFSTSSQMESRRGACQSMRLQHVGGMLSSESLFCREQDWYGACDERLTRNLLNDVLWQRDTVLILAMHLNVLGPSH